jgi:hypothetical protein
VFDRISLLAAGHRDRPTRRPARRGSLAAGWGRGHWSCLWAQRQLGHDPRALSAEIINAARARGSDLIRMTTHGRGGVARAVLVGVAGRVLAHGPTHPRPRSEQGCGARRHDHRAEDDCPRPVVAGAAAIWRLALSGWFASTSRGRRPAPAGSLWQTAESVTLACHEVGGIMQSGQDTSEKPRRGSRAEGAFTGHPAA